MITIYIYQAAPGKRAAWKKAEAEYLKRLSRVARIHFRNLDSLPREAIFFHPQGAALDSPALASLIGEHLQTDSALHLVLGARPLPGSPSVQLLSLPLSPATESVLLLEQLYRAFKIMAKEPYHK